MVKCEHWLSKTEIKIDLCKCNNTATVIFFNFNSLRSLLECGADPTYKDKQGKYPYNYSGTKESRMLFRRFRAKFPDKYDYHKVISITLARI